MDRYAVVGNPIAHSKSPWIHAAFARQTGQALAYEALLAPLDDFAGTVARFRAEGGRGLNVTVPFKLEAFALAGQRTPRAEAAGAVNTLAFGADGTRYACGSAVSPVTDPFFKGLCASLPETRKALSLGWLLGAAALVAGGAYLDGAGRREIAEEIDEEKAAENPEVSAP